MKFLRRYLNYPGGLAMYQAIGQITKKIYATGKNKADVFRKLKEVYSYKNGEIYPELLMIVEKRGRS